MNNRKICEKIVIGFLLVLSLLPIQGVLAQNTNAGFVPANLWYSKDPFEEGDKIQIYTLIFNSDTRQLSGTVNFYDKTTLLGKKDFIVAPKTTKDFSISWTASVGEHKIFAKIENAKFLVSPGKYQNANINQDQLESEQSLSTVKKKVIPATSPEKGLIANTQIKNFENAIVEKIPSFISVPITNAVNDAEEIRKNLSVSTDTRVKQIDTEIQTLNEKQPSGQAKESVNPLLKPWDYIKLFFLNIFSFILNNRFIFYGIVLALIFSVLRFIWHRVF